MRENTERPITVTQGTNRLVGLDPQLIVAQGLEAMNRLGERRPAPELWDGQASRRILDVLAGTSLSATHQDAMSVSSAR